MKTYRLIIKPLSSFLTPFDSDSLFGAVCWAIRWKKGERELKNFLKSYQEEPPFLISNGFRHDCLPLPVLPDLTRDESRNLIKSLFGYINPANYKQGLNLLKELKKVDCIPRDLFKKYVNNFSKKLFLEDFFAGKLNEYNYLYFDIQNKKIIKKINDFFKTKDVYHNNINRLTGTVNEGGLYNQTETKYNSLIDIYVRTNKPGYFREIFRILELEGFGKRRSTGKGQFEIKNNLEENKLPSAVNPNYFMTLSNYVPAEEKIEGFYQLDIKRGKLGSVFASRRDLSPWKLPFVYYQPGS